MTATINNGLDQDILDFIKECNQLEHPESYLIAILHKIQEKYGYLSETHMDQVAHLINVPTANVFGVATFYHFFRLKPRGKYAISVCMGTACFVKGADQVLDQFKTELGIDIGETTQDGLFSIEQTRCIGVCALAPVVTINDRVYSKVTSSRVKEILHILRSEEKAKV
jgi:NADH:ubiquinone oxidoreductase subunit E